jgi:hypothetical protein
MLLNIGRNIQGRTIHPSLSFSLFVTNTPLSPETIDPGK